MNTSSDEMAKAVELCALVAERTRIKGQKYHWWGAFWTYIDEPATSDDAARAIRAEADTIIRTAISRASDGEG